MLSTREEKMLSEFLNHVGVIQIFDQRYVLKSDIKFYYLEMIEDILHDVYLIALVMSFIFCVYNHNACGSMATLLGLFFFSMDKRMGGKYLKRE